MPLDYRNISHRNAALAAHSIVLANGAELVVLDVEPTRDLANVMYAHVHRISRRVYIGVTVLPVLKRWRLGFGYGDNMRFGRAVARHGWDAFEQHIFVLADDGQQLLDVRSARSATERSPDALHSQSPLTRRCCAEAESLLLG
jgi:hypothetical protein